jgi:stage II sporulation protein D
MMSMLLSVAVAANAPLVIRVLEAEKPSHLVLDAASIRCDDAALPHPGGLEVGVRQVRAGAANCAVVSADGPSTLTLASGAHHFAGTLRIVIESGVLKVLNEIDSEKYVLSVVGAQDHDTPRAALEAQAIVARSFALTASRRHAAGGYDVCDTSHCQLYRGQDSESAAAKAAVEKTAGQVLLVGGISMKPAFFHAACGGHTSRAADVFQQDGAGPGVSDVEVDGPLCLDWPNFTWEWTVDRASLGTALGATGDAPAFEVLRRDAGGRVVELKSFGKRFSGEAFFAKVQQAFGDGALRSLKVTAQEAESTVHLRGTGEGHGVGLCQQGARAMARKGADAKAILLKYFPDCRVRVP